MSLIDRRQCDQSSRNLCLGSPVRQEVRVRRLGRATNSATAPCDGIPLADWVGGSSCLDAQSAGTRFSARRPIVLRETSSLAKSQNDSQGCSRLVLSTWLGKSCKSYLAVGGPSLALLEGFHRRCCDASGKRYLGKGPLADQVARYERKITPGVIPFGGTLLQGCCHPGAAFGPKFPSCGKQLDRDSLDPPFARP